MADDTTRVLRRSGIPNGDAYKAAQKKFKTWDKGAITEYDRLSEINTKKTLNASPLFLSSTPDIITCVSSRTNVSLWLSFYNYVSLIVIVFAEKPSEPAEPKPKGSTRKFVSCLSVPCIFSCIIFVFS